MSSFQNLFVTKLPRSVTDLDLYSLFAQFQPRSAKIMLNPFTGKSKGYGFVLFDTPEEGLVAYEALNGKRRQVRGQHFHFILLPSTHNGQIVSAESNALFVRNIPMSATEAEVQHYLGRFGRVRLCTMRPDHSGSPVWVAYVEYDDVATAKSVLRVLHGNWSIFSGGPAPMLAKFAENDAVKAERRRHLKSAATASALPGCCADNSVCFSANDAAGGDDTSGGAGDGCCRGYSHSRTSSMASLTGAATSTTSAGSFAGASASTATPVASSRGKYRHDPYSVQGPYVLLATDGAEEN